MAVTLAATPDIISIRMSFKDVRGEPLVKVFTIDGGTSDADIVNILTYVQNLSNAGVVDCTVSTTRKATGFAAAANALQNSVAMIMALTFTKINPINAAKSVEKSFVIPAFKEALVDTDLKPVEGNANLDSLVALLETNLGYEAADGSLYNGGFDYIRNMSGFGATSREIDGQ